MKWHGIGVRDDTDIRYARPYVYTNTWKTGNLYCYIGNSWKLIGGSCALMIPFIDSNDSQFITQTNVEFLVRQLMAARLKDSNGNYLKDSKSATLYGDYRGT